MPELPVRQMVLYKHGVGYFVREGALNGANLTLSFRHEEINDILKSLAVFDSAGGQVLGIHYQTPMDRTDRLTSSSVNLSENASLHDLIRDIRGRQATLTVQHHEQTRDYTGRIIGIDETPQPSLFSGDKREPIVRVLVLDEQGHIHSLGLLEVQAIRLQDDQAAHDLSYFLDTSMGDDNRRTVNIRLSEGEHQLTVHYVAPSPTWRVSYRVVAESDESGTIGKAFLQGWGLFDNRLEEDLEDVQVTLVAGQPISFIYDLYSSRIPARPTVKDEARVAPGPIEFDDMLGGMDEDELDARLSNFQAEAPRFMAAAPAPQARALRAGGTIAQAKEATPQATAEAKEAGEFFQYVVSTPVSVKRGESALVPIIGSMLDYQRELLYNGAKLPTHPVAALRFKNVTGLTLERGPVTIVEDQDYKGEAIVPFTKDGGEVYLAYAVELGVKITENTISQSETHGLEIKDNFIVYQGYRTEQTTYTIENTTAKDLTITIEAALRPDWKLVDTPTPIAETAMERRWQVEVPKRRKVEFVRQERIGQSNYLAIQNLKYQHLQEFIKQRWLDDATIRELQSLLENLAAIQNAQAEIKQLTAEREAVYKEQEQLRANLGALQALGPEADLRSRMLTQLSTSQDRLDAIAQRQQALKQQIEAAEAKTATILEQFK
ncbi:MAG: hypothetical protein H6673_06355 [Anaerolineales bacterium]|nr:hypothetical protein [Anaerolineales bacterium]